MSMFSTVSETGNISILHIAILQAKASIDTAGQSVYWPYFSFITAIPEIKPILIIFSEKNKPIIASSSERLGIIQ